MEIPDAMIEELVDAYNEVNKNSERYGGYLIGKDKEKVVAAKLRREDAITAIVVRWMNENVKKIEREQRIK
jgi:hypothetical protein